MIIGFVAATAVIGALARWQITELSWRPLGTFVANMTGAFTLGLIAVSAADARTVLGLGGLGALTTVSALVDDAAAMSERGRAGQARAYVASTIVFGIGVAWLGLTIAT